MALVLAIKRTSRAGKGGSGSASDVPTLLGSHVALVYGAPPLSKARDGPSRDGSGSRVPTSPTAVHEALYRELCRADAQSNDGPAQNAGWAFWEPHGTSRAHPCEECSDCCCTNGLTGCIPR